MSNGMHQVTPASFFPTAKELSSGLQWFKEHPLLAAAAATAVSVITYLNTAEDAELVGGDVDDTLAQDQDFVTKSEQRQVENAHSPPVDAPPPPDAASSSPAHATPAAKSDARLPRVSAPTNSAGRATPPVLRKPGSEGKLSPVAVSWVDEHGGSLTQVFEHLSTMDDDSYDEALAAYPDLDEPLRSSRSTMLPRTRGRPPTPRRQASNSSDETTTLAAEVGTAAPVSSASQSAAVSHWMGALAQGGVQSPQPPTGHHGERQTESPQWGWYVAITPPQDLVPGSATATTSGIPRAVVVPTSARSTSSSRPSAGVARGASKDPASAALAMRRSASGRITAA